MTDIERAILRVLTEYPDIRQAILFGSLAAGCETRESDVDLAIAADKPLDSATRISLIETLAQCTGRPVDLVDLRTVGEPLLGQILAHGKRLLGANSGYAELIKRHVFEEADFMPYQRRILSERRSAWIRK